MAKEDARRPCRVVSVARPRSISPPDGEEQPEPPEPATPEPQAEAGSHYARAELVALRARTQVGSELTTLGTKATRLPTRTPEVPSNPKISKYHRGDGSATVSAAAYRSATDFCGKMLK